jgi:hypothetical protein
MEHDSIIDPEDVNSAPSSKPANQAGEIPVPIAMSAAEIDERAQAVEAVSDREISGDDEELQP